MTRSRYHVEMCFLGKDELPLQFKNFLLEIERIQEGNIDPVAFNKRKKEAQSLLANWIEISGGLLFSRVLFEFEEEFITFSENLYREIKFLDRKFDKRRFNRVKSVSSEFLRQMRGLPPIANIFHKTVESELAILEYFSKEKEIVTPQTTWSKTKSLLGITPEFEQVVVLNDALSERRERDQRLIDELYIKDSNGELVLKSYFKMQIPLDPFFKKKRK